MPRVVAMRDGRGRARRPARRSRDAAGRRAAGPADRLRLGALGLTARAGAPRCPPWAWRSASPPGGRAGALGVVAGRPHDQLDALGTNLLTVAPGQDMMGEEATLPDESVGDDRPGADRRRALPRPYARRRRRAARRPGPGRADQRDLRGRGRPRPASTRSPPSCARAAGSTRRPRSYPAVVLGSTAARRLAVGPSTTGSGVARRPGFTVVGILDPVVLAPELDEAALIGPAVAAQALSATTSRRPPSTPASTRTRSMATRAVLGRTANPRRPTRCRCRGRPTRWRPGGGRPVVHHLTLGLGAVALLVGGVGIANVMVDVGAGAAPGDRGTPGARRDPEPRSAASSSPSRCCCPCSAG